ncbi:hypothetical protein GQF56_03710 [Rhodobacter sphaeroides]|mgnify:CR=1 FL=1|jgi:hypothetical protein|uniref:Lipoprotein n=1 Tax=Cereibacter sphaeroides (strain ATCC 17023 / DSM 158 / JCM 6121 / CCUG 31486 / LMG 2827 / NBRC 12203 / NCIMB 8253 / ATH 2.4.1.) TaxID=272943 RepID=Q3J025_CERS4|nr:hypothetical protein [Cereibacter sphaeroides]ABA79859.1 hypothetical protein RSP_0683 [Cereibacter sphaeroides 2.4.1]AMJ48132.1 hypothetical protein APX01_11445 [Cereibacter sphaeroides]ANS34842.1 hypothetical protein A3858_11470 [Cereibacter sphaeroides]ATN63891.1 hypothetical protein A3857_11465 [Cereibacter sphaeroides]AXC62064.1 hypothetical protein DQL45_12030 [Cereibacter sphaeroides 2.4.1]
MRHALTLLLLPLLAACATPQERCISQVTRDLRVVDALIQEGELNLARGYAIEEVTDYRTEWVQCGPPIVRYRPDGKRVVYPARHCFDQVPYTVRQPKAIDLASQARTLEQLKRKRAELARAAGPAVQQCRATYPETK